MRQCPFSLYRSVNDARCEAAASLCNETAENTKSLIHEICSVEPRLSHGGAQLTRCPLGKNSTAILKAWRCLYICSSATCVYLFVCFLGVCLCLHLHTHPSAPEADQHRHPVISLLPLAPWSVTARCPVSCGRPVCSTVSDTRP